MMFLFLKHGFSKEERILQMLQMDYMSGIANDRSAHGRALYT